MKNAAILLYATESDFLRYKRVCSDIDEFRSYADWKQTIEKLIEDYESQGFILHKVYADADAFVEWCRVNSKSPNHSARSEFALFQAMKKSG